MKQLVLINKKKELPDRQLISHHDFTLKGLCGVFTIGLLEADDIRFDTSLPENDYNVLVKILAVSSNYRDIYLLNLYNHLLKKEDASHYVFGSEFVGEIVAVGKKIEHLKVGDRVIPNCAYPEKEAPFPLMEGIPSNSSFSELLLINAYNVVKVPASMSNAEAAGFSVNFFTVYSMLRKLGIDNDQPKNILLFGIKSNVSLSALLALQNRKDITLYGTSSNDEGLSKLFSYGLNRLIISDSNHAVDVNKIMSIRAIAEAGGFDYIIDPFSDMNMNAAAQLLKKNGKYATCGIQNQLPADVNKFDSSILEVLIRKNIQLIFNCLGMAEDIEAAFDDYRNEKLLVPVYKTYPLSAYHDFVQYSYGYSKKPFGKLVLSFEE